MILFDDPILRNQLKPLTLTRPIGKLRIGILTIDQKWEQYSNEKVAFLTENYLSQKYEPSKNELLYVNASVLPSKHLWEEISSLKENEALFKKNHVIAVKSSKGLPFGFDYQPFKSVEAANQITVLQYLPDLFLNNAQEIEADFKLLTQNRVSKSITDVHTRVYGKENIFIEEGADIKAAIISAEKGSVYIGKNAILQEGSLVIGPAAIGENSMVAFGAKIRPNVTLGFGCRVGGEVGNTIFMANANKAHDGFLGNSVIGEWCNLGANTNNSNLKNDYKQVKLYNYNTKKLEPTGELFCGTFMGDYTKAGISTMFNTGTVIGVSSNVFGSGFQEKFIPSFSWGGATEGYENYRFDKAIEVINATMARREKQLSEKEINILKWICEDMA